MENGSVRVKWPTPGKVKPFSPLNSAAWPVLPATSFGPSWAFAGWEGVTEFAAWLSLISSKEKAATNPATVGAGGLDLSHSRKGPRAASRMGSVGGDVRRLGSIFDF